MLIMPVVTYDRVNVAATWCLSCAGDAKQTWAIAAQRGSALTCDPEHGWVGRIAGIGRGSETGADLWAEALAAGRSGLDPQHLTAVSASASKPEFDPLRPTIMTDWWRQSGTAALAGLGLRQAISVPVAAACSTGLYGLLAVADRIECGDVDQGIALAVDRPLAPLLMAGYRNLGVACGQRQPPAFPADHGFAPAEGAAAVVLRSSTFSAQPTPSSGWQLIAGVRAADASHATAFADPDTLIAALRAMWRIVPEPDVIVLHGTGTARGDDYEAFAMNAGPWKRGMRIAMKPAIGHALGASGLVELAATCTASVRSFWKISMGFGGHLALVACARSR